MSKKTEALRSIEAAVKELQEQPAPGPVDFDLVLSTAEKVVVVGGVAALIVIAGTLVRLAWSFGHMDTDPMWDDMWEGGSQRVSASSDSHSVATEGRSGQSAAGAVSERSNMPCC